MNADDAARFDAALDAAQKAEWAHAERLDAAGNRYAAVAAMARSNGMLTALTMFREAFCLTSATPTTDLTK